MYYNPLTGQYDVKKSRRLKNLDITEVSLVGRPANNRPFLFFKGEKDMDSVMDLLDIVEQIQKSIKLSDSQAASVNTFMKTLDGLKQDEIEAISDVLLLMRRLSLPEGSMTKRAKNLWPTLTKAILDAPTSAEPRNQDADGALKWPSLAGLS